MKALEYEAVKATKEVDKYESDLDNLSSIPSKGSLSTQLGSQSRLIILLLSEPMNHLTRF